METKNRKKVGKTSSIRRGSQKRVFRRGGSGFIGRIVTPESHPGSFKRIIDVFSTHRTETGILFRLAVVLAPKVPTRSVIHVRKKTDDLGTVTLSDRKYSFNINSDLLQQYLDSEIEISPKASDLIKRYKRDLKTNERRHDATGYSPSALYVFLPNETNELIADRATRAFVEFFEALGFKGRSPE